MSGADKVAWSLIEDAVQRENGIDEELTLMHIIRSYLIRRGLANTLLAFDHDVLLSAYPTLETELTSNANHDKQELIKGDDGNNNNNNKTHANSDSYTELAQNDMWSEEQEAFWLKLAKRKQAQVLCMNAQYEEAAKLLPFTSVVRLKLLCMAALYQHSDATDRLLFITQHITSLVVMCDNSRVAHTLYTTFISKLVRSTNFSLPIKSLENSFDESNYFWDNAEINKKSRKDAAQRPLDNISREMQYALANEINEVLLADKSPNAIDVLMLWSDWLDHVTQNVAM